MAAEITRLKEGWKRPGEAQSTGAAPSAALTEAQREELDPFDLVQLDYVLKVCRESKSLSDAGRKLYAVSRAKKVKSNDADRLKKYLARFDLTWDLVQ